MNTTITITRGAAFQWFCAFSLLLLVGCPVTLISHYDPEIDRSATALQKEMDSFLTKLETVAETPEAQYAQHNQFYDDYLVELRSVLVRAQSHPKNSIN